MSNASTISKAKMDLFNSAECDYTASNFITSADEADIVGTGSFGVVRRCRHDHLKDVVVKCMHCGGSFGTALNSIETARKQIRFFAQFIHENIVRTYGITSWGQYFGIVMEEIKCGNLHDLIVNKNVKTIDWKIRYRIVFQLADALKYLHFHDSKKSYVHLDVKPENILLTEDLNVKLADFGSLDIAKSTGVTSATSRIPSSNQYTLLYTAPERLKDVCGTKIEKSMDVYSFAMVCYEVITRQKVFQDVRANVSLIMNTIAYHGQKPNTKIIDDLEQKLQRQNKVDYEIFQHLRKIMENCWCETPTNRLSMNGVYQSLVEFAKSENPYESDARINSQKIAKIILQNQKLVVPVGKKVSLNLHFAPFHFANNAPPRNSAGQTTNNDNASFDPKPAVKTQPAESPTNLESDKAQEPNVMKNNNKQINNVVSTSNNKTVRKRDKGARDPVLAARISQPQQNRVYIERDPVLPSNFVQDINFPNSLPAIDFPQPEAKLDRVEGVQRYLRYLTFTNCIKIVGMSVYSSLQIGEYLLIGTVNLLISTLKLFL